MGLAAPLVEALRRLCCEVGWSYAVFWKAIGAADPVHLIFEDGFCARKSSITNSEASSSQHADVQLCTDQVDGEVDESVDMLVNKMMISQVHVIGEGIVGQAALTGNYRWIVRETLNNHGFVGKDATEISSQILAGIQTIVVVPVLPHGVLQLGSTSPVIENLALVLHAKRACSRLNSRPGAVTSGPFQVDIREQNGSHSAVTLVTKTTDAHSKDRSGSRVSSTRWNQHCHSAEPVDALLKPDNNSSSRKTVANAARGYPERVLCSIPVSQNGRQVCHDDMMCGSRMNLSTMTEASTLRSSLSLKEQVIIQNTGISESGGTKKSAEDWPGNISFLMESNGLCFPTVSESLQVMHAQARREHYDNIGRVIGSSLLCDNVNAARASTNDSTTYQIPGQGFYSMANSLHHQSNITHSLPYGLKVPDAKACRVEDSASACSGSDVKVYGDSLVARFTQSGGLSGLNHHTDIFDGVNDSGTDHILKAKNVMKDEIHISTEKPQLMPTESGSGNDLFDMFGPRSCQFSGNLDDIMAFEGEVLASCLNTDAQRKSACPQPPAVSAVHDDFSDAGIFSAAEADQLLDAVISNINPTTKMSLNDFSSCKTSTSDVQSSCYAGSTGLKPFELSVNLPVIVNKHDAASSSSRPSLLEGIEENCLSQSSAVHKSQLRLLVESGQNMRNDSTPGSNSKSLDTANRPVRKRSRPGENPRPRPKDRQLIQDRIKELREIVPNGAKCSIDVLLEKTIKHMVFLQSVTKHAEKLKDPTEQKVVGSENAMLTRENFEGGTTWAFEVGAQSMSCPIIVEDLDRPRQMLIEMLCDDRGIFLEIADFIRGLGLTILKGIMEAQNKKIWARFTVEANRDMTRMEVFFSLVRLLEPNGESSECCRTTPPIM